MRVGRPLAMPYASRKLYLDAATVCWRCYYVQASLCRDCISAHIKRIKTDSDAHDLSVPGAAIGTGTNRIPNIKTTVEMESIFVPGQSQISKQPALALFADC
jgi:hypothetical protein